VVSGYSGGASQHPTYQDICTGRTGHAECVQISFDPGMISYEELLAIFWQVHDPTTLNRQGADVGTQYRSVIFYHNQEQRKLAEHFKKELDESGAYQKHVVTEIAPFEQFFPAEQYHQNYYELNQDKNPYCPIVIKPKLDKFRKVFKEKLKDKVS
jgi:peptide-methionine (S)-S-oxide reductase